MPREFFVQAEIVLYGDGGVGFGLLFYGDILLRLDRLVQALAPPPAVHYAPRVRVDYVHLAALHDVFDVLFVYRVRAQQLADAVDVFGEGVKFVFRAQLCLLLFLRGHRFVGVDFDKYGRQVGQHEGVGIFGVHGVAPLFGEVARQLLFVDYVIQLLLAAEALLLAEVGCHFHVDFVELLPVCRRAP